MRRPDATKKRDARLANVALNRTRRPAAGHLKGGAKGCLTRMEISIRRGLDRDATAAVDVLRRSISELCTADHNNDEREIRDWLANKTEASWTAWVRLDDAIVLIAEAGGRAVGVGMVRHAGEILLNYVHPDARFNGVSKLLLMAMENEALRLGARSCRLESTVTARRFYLCCGYTPTTADGLRLEKALSK